MNYVTWFLLFFVSVPFTYGQTVIKVVDGTSVQLNDGRIVRMRDVYLPLASDKQEEAKVQLMYYVLDRSVDLVNAESAEWGEITAHIYWRGVDIRARMLSHHLLLKVPPNTVEVSQTPSPSIAPSQAAYMEYEVAAPQARVYSVPPQVSVYSSSPKRYLVPLQSTTGTCANGQCGQQPSFRFWPY